MGAGWEVYPASSTIYSAEHGTASSSVDSRTFRHRRYHRYHHRYPRFLSEVERGQGQAFSFLG